MIHPVRFVASFLFISGMCALVFQAAWLREFRLIFGASTPASAAVMAIFMGGLGLGNAWLGRRCDRSSNPLRLYAKFEMAISVSAIVSPFLVMAVRAIYIAVGGQESLGLIGATVVRLVLASLVMGLPTFMMGGTLPAAARAVTTADDVSRRLAALLYGMNALGAVLGVAVSTFYLLEKLGTHETLWAAGLLNLVNSLVAWKLSSASSQRSVTTDAAIAPVTSNATVATEKVIAPATTATLHQPAATLYLVAGVVGFVFFLMELVWYRMLGPILGGSTFTFGLILAVALAGIGIGGAIYAALFKDRVWDSRSLAITLGWEAFAIAIPFALGDRLAVLALTLRFLSYYGFLGQVVSWLMITMIVVFPAALISGVQFPMLIALIGRGSRDVGKQIGNAIAWNTVGAVLGSLVGGFGVTALMSATDVWKVVVILLAGTGLALLMLDFRHVRRMNRLIQPFAVMVAAAACLMAIGPTAVWRHSGIGAGRAQMPFPTRNDLHGWMNEIRRGAVWEVDGRESSVAMIAHSGVTLMLNGKSDGNAVIDAGTQIMLGVLGALLHEQPRDAMVIGLGTGETAGWLAHQPSIQRVDVVELEPAVLRVAELCAPMNHDVLRHAKARFVFNDARETLQTTRTTYDLIASAPSNPYRSGVSSLYTREFYQSVRDRLKPKGIFLKWLQGYEIDVATFRTVLCTLSDTFRYVEIWETAPSDLLMVCSMEPFDYTANDLRRRMSDPAMADSLRVAWQTSTVEGVLAHLIANEQFARSVADQQLAPVNTDNRNVLEYGFARTVGQPVGFTVFGLRSEAMAAGAVRARRLSTGVEWDAVDDEVLAYTAVNSVLELRPGILSGDRSFRADALRVFQTREGLRRVAQRWDEQSKPPRDLIEMVAVATGYADTGDDRAEKLIESIRASSPIEADVIAALLATRRMRDDQAVGLLVNVFTKLRSDPTAMASVVDIAIRIALEIAAREPGYARRLYDALSQPFGVLMAHDQRVMALCTLGRRIGPRETAAALRLMEPNPHWSATILEMRVQAYQEMGDALAPRARRDLEQFNANTSERVVLPPR